MPAKAEFLTDGPSRTVKVGKTTIQLKRTTPRNMAAGKLAGLVIQALRALGERNVTPERVEHLRRTIPAKERRELLKDLAVAPAWMHPILRSIAEGA